MDVTDSDGYLRDFDHLKAGFVCDFFRDENWAAEAAKILRSRWGTPRAQPEDWPCGP